MRRLIAAAIGLSLLAGCHKRVSIVRDPLVVEQHRSRISKVRNAIDETRGVIAASRGAPYLPELYMRLAELTSEEARYHYMVASEREQGAAALHVPQVRVLKEQAIGTYNLIINRYPESHLTDRILFNISQEYRELGSFDKMRGSLERLVKEYPDSPYYYEALLVLGNHHFDKSELPVARNYFKKIVSGPPGPLAGLANYRLGWVDVNMGDCRRALRHFEAAIDADRDAGPAVPIHMPNAADEVLGEFAIPESTSKSSGFAGHESVDVQREALVDLTYCYAQARKPEDAAEYLRERASSREAYVAALGKMANRFAIIEQPVGAAEVTRALLKLAPDDPERLDDGRMLHNVVTRMGDYSSVGSDVSLMLHALRRQTMRPEFDEAAGARTEKEFEALTRDMATRSHDVLRGDTKTGQTYTAIPAINSSTAEAYRVWLATFTQSPHRLQIIQNLADVLLADEKFLEAGRRYRDAADLLALPAEAALVTEEKKEGEEEDSDAPPVQTPEQRAQARLDALFNAAVAYQKALEAEGDKTHLDLAVSRAGLRDAGGQYLTEGQPPPAKALRIKFAIGRTYYDEGDYDRAIDLLTAVAWENPRTEQGDAAAHLVLDSYNTINDISGLFAVGRRFLDPASPISANVKAQIAPIVDAAEQRRLDELSLAASGDAAGGMGVLLAFADRYKGTDLGERALLGTFVAARAAGDPAQLYSVGEELLKRFGGSEQAAGVANTMGQTAASQFEFDRAVAYFERAAGASPDPATGAAYLLAAGELREQLADHQGAGRAYRDAMNMAEGGETRTEAITHLADLTERYGSDRDVIKLLEPLADSREPEVLSRLGLAMLRSGRPDEGEMHVQRVVSGSAAASSGAQARAYYGVAEAMLAMLMTYEPPSELEAIEESIGMVEVTVQSYLAAARQPDFTYSQAALSRLATSADRGAQIISSIQLPATLSGEEAALLSNALQRRAEQLRSGRDEALGECAQRARSSHRVDTTGKACISGQPPQSDPVKHLGLSPRQAPGGLPDLANAKEGLARNPNDLEALREVATAYLDAGDAHTARLVLGRAVDAGGTSQDLNLLGIASYRAGDMIGAQDAFGRAGAAGSGPAMRNLAHIYRKLGLTELAEDTLLEAPPGKGRLLQGVE